MRLPRLIAGGVAALVVGCTLGGPVAYFPLRDAPRAMAPRSPAEVKVFDIVAPDRPFVEVGILQVEQSQFETVNQSDLVVRLRDEGARRGCDGVVMKQNWNAARGGSMLLGYRASCIVFETPASG